MSAVVHYPAGNDGRFNTKLAFNIINIQNLSQYAKHEDEQAMMCVRVAGNNIPWI